MRNKSAATKRSLGVVCLDSIVHSRALCCTALGKKLPDLILDLQ